MSTAWLFVVLFGACAVIAVVLNQIQARLALLEVTLNEGLPPGHADMTSGPSPAPLADADEVLGPGVHLFLSRTCHACQRLVDALAQANATDVVPLAIHAVDRPRPATRNAAQHLGAQLVEEQLDAASSLGADPLPHAIAVGDHGLVAQGAAPTIERIRSIAHDAGISMARSRR